MSEKELEKIYQKMSAERRKYVTPVELTWEQVFAEGNGEVLNSYIKFIKF